MLDYLVAHSEGIALNIECVARQACAHDAVAGPADNIFFPCSQTSRVPLATGRATITREHMQAPA